MTGRSGAIDNHVGDPAFDIVGFGLGRHSRSDF